MEVIESLPEPIALEKVGVAPEFLDVVALAQRLVHGRRASLMLPMGNGGLLRVVAASGLPVEATRSHVRVGDPISGIVAQRKQPILMNQVVPQVSDRAARYETGSFISAPVSIKDDQIGVLNVADPQGGYFHTDDLTAIVTLASQIGRSVAWGLAQEQIQQLEQMNRHLRREAIQAVEEDRQRIARDLHDEAGHSITAAIFRLDLALARLPADESGSRAMIETVRATLLDYTATLHTLAFGLRPRILQDLGLGAALRSLVHQVQDDRTLDVVLRIEGELSALTEDLELLIFRVVQEALTNTRKHARASRLEVTLRCTIGHLVLTIEDDGIGIDRTSLRRNIARPSLGLAGIQERVELFGGAFTIGPRSSGGTCLTVYLPF